MIDLFEGYESIQPWNINIQQKYIVIDKFFIFILYKTKYLLIFRFIIPKI
jgi:hypothetical protein